MRINPLKEAVYCDAQAAAAADRFLFAKQLAVVCVTGAEDAAARALSDVKFYRREARAWRALQKRRSA